MRKFGSLIALTWVCTGLILGFTGCGSSSDDDAAGRTLHGTYSSFPDYLDPALSFSIEGWTAMQNTYLPLLTYAHAEGTAGTRLIPALAKSLPRISDGGRTYTLFLRPGLSYSDGTPVRASDFTHSVERLFEVNSPGLPFYTDIVGAERFAKTKKGGIAGIQTEDQSGEIIIHLVTPRGTFSNELGLLFVALLPADTPAEDLSAKPPPATGPYVITASHPGRSWEYRRTPQWGRRRPALPPLPTPRRCRTCPAAI